jgi:hypothetical protein
MLSWTLAGTVPVAPSAAGRLGLIAVRRSVVLGMVYLALSFYDGHLAPAVTAVLSVDDRRVMLPGSRS